MGRWLRRITIVLLLLIVGTLVVIQVVLSSDLPRRKIVEAIEAETGLSVEITSCRVGWTGATTINRLALRLDESADPIARVDRLDVQHNSLWSVLVSRKVRVQTVDLDGATVRAAQDEQDRWDVQRAVDRIMERQQDTPASDAAPVVTANDMRIEAAGRPFSLRGEVSVRIVDSKVRLEPKSLDVTSPDGAFEPITLSGGEVLASAQRVNVSNVQIETDDAAARVEGHWTPSQTGGPHQLVATIVTSGSISDVQWNGTLQITALGPTPRQMEAHLSVTAGEVTRDDATLLELEGLAAVVKLQYPSVQLASLSYADRDTLTVSGRVNTQSRQWSGKMRLRQWPMSDAPLDLNMTAKGRGGSQMTVEAFTLQRQAVVVSGSGSYAPSRDTPVDATINVQWRPEDLPEGAAGRFAYSAKAGGSIQPIDIHAEGVLRGAELSYNNATLADLSVPLAVHVDDAHATWQSEPFAMLGGDCIVTGRRRLNDGDTQVTVELKQVALATVAPIVDKDLVLAGALNATIDLRPEQLSGDWAVSDLRAGPMTASQVSGRFTIDDNVLTIDPLELRKQSGSAAGRMTVDLNHAEQATVAFEIDNWPIALEDERLRLAVSGQCEGKVDLVDYTADGSLSLQTQVTAGHRDLGVLDVAGTLAGSRLELDRVAGDVFGGHIEGAASLHLHDHTASTGQLAVSNLDASALASFAPELQRAGGRIDGQVEARAAGERAPEPLRVDITLTPTDGALRGVPWGGTTAAVFVGSNRVIVDQSQIAIADGTLGVWASATRREGDWYLQTQLDLQRLEYNQLRASFESGGEPVRARLSGKFRIAGPVDPFSDMTGQGRLDVAESDLANSSIFGGVLSRLGVSDRPETPQGKGEATFRIERGALYIDWLDYANRGVNFRAGGVVKDLIVGRESPIDLNIVATNKPLAGIQLPGRAEFDRIFSSLQSSFTAFRITGTVGEPSLAPAAIADFAGTVEGFLKRRDERQRSDDNATQ